VRRSAQRAAQHYSHQPSHEDRDGPAMVVAPGALYVTGKKYERPEGEPQLDE
jgi:hypothetical protein